MWSGSVTETTAEVRALPVVDFDNAELLVATDPSLEDARRLPASDPHGRVIGFHIDGLTSKRQSISGLPSWRKSLSESCPVRP